MTDALPLPEDFWPLARTSPFADLIGPIHQKAGADGLILGVRAESKHCNVRGHVHGGMLATLADIAMGYSTAFSTQPPTALVTVNLSIDYAGKAALGDWIEVHTDIHKVGRSLAFANCHLLVGSTRIARASAVFSIPESRQ